MSAPTGAGRASSRLDPRWLWLPLGLLLAVAFAVSYSHGVAVFTARGQGGWVARVLAGTPELMAVTALLALAAGVLTGWARLVLVVSVGATVVLNVAAAAPQWDHQLAALWPAVAFLLPLPLAHGRTGPPAAAGRPEAVEPVDQHDQVDQVEAGARGAAVEHDPAPSVVQPARRAPRPRQAGAGAAGDLVAVLDQLGVPSGAGRDRCRSALTGAGLSASTAALSAAVRARKTGPTGPDLTAPDLTDPDLTADPTPDLTATAPTPDPSAGNRADRAA